ncbi:CaiB/BaiF CoA transferase family protein [Sphingomonas sp. AX6]|uniref:CaiB/BaiF CoA transferase family protein n=1 Tax=Sphingomonas sp. AX6 TaxID=2653171 RepID=UPI0012F1FE2D|nr:CaiB/BaiF CoA-transferase family protein [Sphingomonas sp. AX6]VXC91138.1 Carnitine dehydratase [Sphingomonas sp. AX6]
MSLSAMPGKRLAVARVGDRINRPSHLATAPNRFQGWSELGEKRDMPGPLAGLRVVEFAALGPAPFGAMLLSDLGAEVLRIDRADAAWPQMPIVSRGRSGLTLDLKSDEGRARAMAAMDAADVAIEGLRPGVMERLGLGPDTACVRNDRLIYARMTGWGQDGPRAQAAGHDINYIGLTGLLAMLSPEGEAPRPPLNLLGDYAAGSLYLVIGILAALAERSRSGKGQMVDAAIVDGSVSLMAPILGMIAGGLMPADPNKGLLAGNAPYYRSYLCADGLAIAVGPLEPQFRRALTGAMGLDSDALNGEPVAAAQMLAKQFATQPREYWLAPLDSVDACATPIHDWQAARADPHLVARGVFGGDGPVPDPAVAPRFSRTPGAAQPDGDGAELLDRWIGQSR